MKNKQILGLVVAGLVFIATGVTSVFTQKAAGTMFADGAATTVTEEMESIFASSGVDISLPMNDFIGVVRVEGTIADVGSSSAFSTVSYDHQGTLDYIDQMMNSDYNKGILLCVNSPGGTVYDSDELYLKLMDYKETTGRPVWAYMESEACSGGYYISMAADQIGANRNAWTGSIGVIISYYSYRDLFKELGVEEVNITSGKNKAMGSSGTKLTKEQRDIMQSLVDESYEQFVDIVAAGRDMAVDEVKPLADGRIYTAKQAMDVGLIDEVISYDEFQSEIISQVGEDAEFYEPSFVSDTLFTSLFSTFKGSQSKSDAQVLSEFLEKEGNGVPLYYAGNE